MLLSQLRAYSDAVTAADFERLCHTATEHVFVWVRAAVDGSRPCQQQKVSATCLDLPVLLRAYSDAVTAAEHHLLCTPMLHL